MRPASIVQFGRLFLASIAVSAVADGLAFYAAATAPKVDPLIAKMGVIPITLFQLVPYLIALGVWYLIVSKRSVFAKWVASGLFVLSTCIMALTLFKGGFNLGLISLLSWAAYLLRAWAVSYLFKPDADEWFAKKPSAS